jgi:pyruvate dehydrogenase E2 component (dihydrolipoamide acetyltransferase)
MAVPAIIPKLGNTVESCIIVEWKKALGEPVVEGETLLEVETDKAVMEVPSPASGVVLAHLYAVGDLAPVLEPIAVIGEPGEDYRALLVGETGKLVNGEIGRLVDAQPSVVALEAAPSDSAAAGPAPISPRARGLAQREGVAVAGLAGSGPAGRIIERDVQAALASRPKLSPVAQAKLTEGGFVAPERGSGPGGRVMTRDLRAVAEGKQVDKAEVDKAEVDKAGAAKAKVDKAEAGKAEADMGAREEVEVVKVTGVRKVIAERMLASLQTTAQLTLNASADARTLQALRARFKGSDPAFGLQGVTINDLILLAVARTLPAHPDLNAHFQGDTLRRYRHVQLGMAVDTPAGLMVPVIGHADQLSLREISTEAKRLAAACQARRVTPDELRGGTFTVTNLGGLGVESFTPVLNPPEVAILGVSNINLKAVQVRDASAALSMTGAAGRDASAVLSMTGAAGRDASALSMTGQRVAELDETRVAFVPHIGLSLTINHQVVDGAPAARFLQALARNLVGIDLLLAG